MQFSGGKDENEPLPATAEPLDLVHDLSLLKVLAGAFETGTSRLPILRSFTLTETARL
jgi:hypothetical protein